MEFSIYEEKIRKVKGEDTSFLSLVAEVSDFESIEEALEALMEEVPEYLGVELIVFSQEPVLVTVNENPSKYAVTVNGGNVATVVDEEDEEEEADEPPPAPKPRRARRNNAASAKRAPAKSGGKKASPFRSNPKSAE
jgi:septum formation inhibitor MinC